MRDIAAIFGAVVLGAVGLVAYVVLALYDKPSSEVLLTLPVGAMTGVLGAYMAVRRVEPNLPPMSTPEPETATVGDQAVRMEPPPPVDAREAWQPTMPPPVPRPVRGPNP